VKETGKGTVPDFGEAVNSATGAKAALDIITK
jgi:hypothetical protein